MNYVRTHHNKEGSLASFSCYENDTTSCYLSAEIPSQRQPVYNLKNLHIHGQDTETTNRLSSSHSPFMPSELSLLKDDFKDSSTISEF